MEKRPDAPLLRKHQSIGIKIESESYEYTEGAVQKSLIKNRIKEEWKNARSGLAGTFFNILNVMVGTGIVVLPNMMLQTG